MRSFEITGKAPVVLILFSFFCFYSIAVAGQAATVGASQSTNPPAATQTQSADPRAEKEKDAKDASNEASADAKSEAKDEHMASTNRSEDWNKLAIPDGLRAPEPVTPPMKADFPTYTREYVQFMWRKEDRVDLYVIKPVGVTKPPVILYLYSFPTDMHRFAQDEFDQTVTKNGFAAVGFVSAMTGERFHNRPMKEWFVSDLQEALGSSVHDVQLILNYLTTRGDLDMTRVGMFGDGSGASIAIMAAATDPRIQALDLFDAWGDWPNWMAHSKLILAEDERAQYTKPEFLKNVENLDPVKYLPQLTKQRVRLQYLKTDHITPEAARTRMVAAAPANATIVQYQDGADFMNKMVTSKKIFDWIQQQVVVIPAVATQGSEPANGTQPAAADKVVDR